MSEPIIKVCTRAFEDQEMRDVVDEIRPLLGREYPTKHAINSQQVGNLSLIAKCSLLRLFIKQILIFRRGKDLATIEVYLHGV